MSFTANANSPARFRRLLFFSATCVVFMLFFGVASPGGAVEKFVTTAGLVKTAPHIAHVRVTGFRSAPGVAALEYDLEVLEALKGNLPGQIHMRMFSGFRVINPGGAVHPDGSEWLVFLGRGRQGVYPLRSLQWGRIDIGTHAQTGEQYLIKELSGFPAPDNGRYHSLSEFRAVVRRLLGR